jgi:hypothetical protein
MYMDCIRRQLLFAKVDSGSLLLLKGERPRSTWFIMLAARPELASSLYHLVEGPPHRWKRGVRQSATGTEQAWPKGHGGHYFSFHL